MIPDHNILNLPKRVFQNRSTSNKRRQMQFLKFRNRVCLCLFEMEQPFLKYSDDAKTCKKAQMLMIQQRSWIIAQRASN